MTNIDQGWINIALILGGLLLGLLTHYVVFKIAGTMAGHTKTVVDDSLTRHCRAPARIIIPLVVLQILFPLLTLSPGLYNMLKQISSAVLVISLAWLVIKLLSVVEDALLDRFKVDVKDNLEARRVHTQIKIFKRIIVVGILVLAFAVLLMSFDKVRYLGTSILASAGVAGIIIGFAAQRSISTLIAGIQIAVTQPIRLDDVVIVENEWGRVEEITLTYVVVRIWDLRRMILPITYFMEKPFQNWTRVTADLLGSVYLYVDYQLPVDEIREEFRRILEKSEMWDRKTWALQVTDTTEKTMQLRALMSAADASAAWNLRCEVREKLVTFIQEKHPECLPKTRAVLGPQPSCPVRGLSPAFPRPDVDPR